MTVEDINWSCPSDMEPYIGAYKMSERKQDEFNWMLGAYVQDAVAVAVEHCFAGKKAKSKYLEKPFIQQAEEKNKELTPEELDREIRKAIFNEQQWSAQLKAQGMPETVIKKKKGRKKKDGKRN